MKFIAISDTHCQTPAIPDGDVLLHAGDATFRGDVEEVTEFAAWMKSLPHKHKVFVPGNHDWLFQQDEALARKFMSGITVLIDQGHEIDGVKIWGSPWQPEFNNWAFNLKRGNELAEKWAMIPEGTDILITHGPPQKRLDRVEKMVHDWQIGLIRVGGENVGCWDLARAVDAINPQYHVFGHVHRGYGRTVYHSTTFLNASICNERYEPVQKPWEFECTRKHQLRPHA